MGKTVEKLEASFAHACGISDIAYISCDGEEHLVTCGGDATVRFREPTVWGHVAKDLDQSHSEGVTVLVRPCPPQDDIINETGQTLNRLQLYSISIMPEYIEPCFKY